MNTSTTALWHPELACRAAVALAAAAMSLAGASCSSLDSPPRRLYSGPPLPPEKVATLTAGSRYNEPVKMLVPGGEIAGWTTEKIQPVITELSAIDAGVSFTAMAGRHYIAVIEDAMMPMPPPGGLMGDDARNFPHGPGCVLAIKETESGQMFHASAPNRP